jgi:hypothetical protein
VRTHARCVPTATDAWWTKALLLELVMLALPRCCDASSAGGARAPGDATAAFMASLGALAATVGASLTALGGGTPASQSDGRLSRARSHRMRGAHNIMPEEPPEGPAAPQHPSAFPARCPVPDCTHEPLRNRSGWSMHQSWHAQQTVGNAAAGAAAVASAAEDDADAAWQATHLPSAAPPGAIPTASWLYVASLDVPALLQPGGHDVVEFIPRAALTQTCDVFADLLKRATRSERGATNMLALFAPFVLDKPERGGAGGAGRGTNEIQRALRAAAASSGC